MFAVTSLRSAARHCCRVSTAAAARNIQPRGTLLASTQSRFASTLVLSDPLTADGETPAATLSAVTAATQLNDSSEPIELLVVGTVAPTKIPAGISKVYHAKTSQQDTTAETIASTLHSTVTAGSYDYVVGTSTKFGATVIPRAAALLGASPITDIIQVISAGEQKERGKRTIEPCVCGQWDLLFLPLQLCGDFSFFFSPHTFLSSSSSFETAQILQQCFFSFNIRYLCSSHVRW